METKKENMPALQRHVLFFLYSQSYQDYAKRGGLLFTQQQFHNLASCFGHRCARAENGSHASFVEEIIVLRRDDSTCDDDDVFAAQLLQFLNHLRDECLVPGCE